MDFEFDIRTDTILWRSLFYRPIQWFTEKAVKARGRNIIVARERERHGKKEKELAYTNTVCSFIRFQAKL